MHWKFYYKSTLSFSYGVNAFKQLGSNLYCHGRVGQGTTLEGVFQAEMSCSTDTGSYVLVKNTLYFRGKLIPQSDTI